MEEEENKFQSVATASDDNADDPLNGEWSRGELNVYVCKPCEVSLSSSGALDYHLLSSHVIRRGRDCFSCGCHPCDVEFPAPAPLITHLRLEHTEQKFRSCCRCGKEFNRPYCVPTHPGGDPPSKMYCDLCVVELKTAKDGVDDVMEGENGEESETESVHGVSPSRISGKSNDGGRSQTEGETDSYVCQICLLGFTSPDALDDHLHSSHVVTRFSCGSCGREFETLEVLMGHLRREHTVQNFSFCVRCGRKFARSLYASAPRDESEKLYCDLCMTERQNGRSQVVAVMNRKETEEITSQSATSVSGNTTPCDTDEDRYNNASSDDEADSYICQVCQLGVSSSDALDDHLCSMHVVESGNTLSCGSCKKAFKAFEMLINHLRCNHTVRKIHSCGQCGEKFPFIHSVATHSRKRESSKLYCALCIKERESAKKNIVSGSKDCNRVRESETVRVSKGSNSSQGNETVKMSKISNSVQVSETAKVSKETSCVQNSEAAKASKESNNTQDSETVEVLKESNSAQDSGYSCRYSDHILADQLVQKPSENGNIRKSSSYPCRFCHEILKSSFALQRHINFNHSEKPYRCKICKKRFAYPHLLRRHTLAQVCDASSTYSCDMCEKLFCSKYTLQQHRLRHARKVVIICKICQMEFPDKETLSAHKFSHDLQRRAAKTTASDSHTSDQKDNTTPLKNRNLCRKRKFACDICSKRFWNRAILLDHQRNHCGKNSCELCHKEFFSADNLKRHLRVHSGEKPYLCETCGKGFTRRLYLEDHKRVHTGEKFACDICAKEYSSKTSLQNHKVSHTGEKAHSCEVCDKKFYTRHYLQMHMKTHSGVKPPLSHVCEECGRGFSRRDQLNRHRRTHTGEKPYECDICRRAFSLKSLMVNHRRIHTGERPFECDVCLRRFISREQMNRHQRIHADSLEMNSLTIRLM